MQGQLPPVGLELSYLLTPMGHVKQSLIVLSSHALLITEINKIKIKKLL
jgi:hypothetical protein